MSELTRYPWDKVYQLTIAEFFYYVCYIRDKAAKEARDIKKWQKIH